MPPIATSAQMLINSLRRPDGNIWLMLHPSSDLPGLRRAVLEHASSEPSTKWNIAWIRSGEGNNKYESSEELVELIEAIGKQTRSNVLLTMPLKAGDFLKLMQALLPHCKASSLQIEVQPDQERTEEETEKEVLEVLNEISTWNGLESLRLAFGLPLSLEPKGKLMSTLAEILPDLSVKELNLFLEEPSGWDEDNQTFTTDLEQAIAKVQYGLEKNYDLEDLFIGPAAVRSPKLNKLMVKLTQQKFGPLLLLNLTGRGVIESLPFHRDTWLEILARHTNDVDLDAVFYYLRKNTWLFTPEVDLEAQNRRLCAQVEDMDKKMAKHQQEKEMEIQALVTELGEEEKRHKTELGAEKKRHKAEFGAEKKRHKAELGSEKKNHKAELEAEKKRYKAELGAEKKCHKAELGAEKKHHKAELKAKDQEIRKLQAKLRQGKDMN